MNVIILLVALLSSLFGSSQPSWDGQVFSYGEPMVVDGHDFGMDKQAFVRESTQEVELCAYSYGGYIDEVDNSVHYMGWADCHTMSAEQALLFFMQAYNVSNIGH